MTLHFSSRFAFLRQIVAGLLLMPLMALAQTLPDAAAVNRYANELLDQYRVGAQGPGVAVLVARGDDLLMHMARGQANVELGVPLSPDHRFRISSTAKQITAALLLKLVDEGKARLDDRLAKYLPQFPNGGAITLAMLLNHTSGVKSYTSIDNYEAQLARRDLKTSELIDVFKDLPVDFAPGSGYAYNNSGYVLAGAVIEAITGKPWWDGLSALKAPLFPPLPGQLIPGQVNGYMLSSDGRVVPASLSSLVQSHGAGSLVGDLKAMWRWNQQLHEQGFLKPESYRRMTTPEGAAVTEGYGLGLYISSLRGQRFFTHGAGHFGFAAWLHYLPSQRITVVLLRNSEGAAVLDGLGRQLAAFAAGTPFPEVKPLNVAPEQLKRFEGVYRRGSVTRTLRVVGNALVSQRGNGPTFTLVPVGTARFVFSPGVTQMTFEEDAAGKVTGLRLFVNGEGEGEVSTRSTDLPS
jgi:D-alanyl-D-alanine carboxypeptidase